MAVRLKDVTHTLTDYGPVGFKLRLEVRKLTTQSFNKSPSAAISALEQKCLAAV